jgi:hypothetical protein
LCIKFTVGKHCVLIAQAFSFTVLSHRFNSRTDSGRSRAVHPPKHDPTKLHCFLAPMCRRKHHTPGDCVSMHCTRPATGVAGAQWDKDIPPLTRTTLGQLCAAPWVFRSWPAGFEPRISNGTDSTVMQCLRPLRHSGGQLTQLCLHYSLLEQFSILYYSLAQCVPEVAI